MKLTTFMFAALCATAAQADTFSVQLGGKTLGTIEYDTAGSTARLRSTLDSTPLGVFDGTFAGTSTGSTASSRFTAESRSTRKARIVTVDIRAGRAVAVEITPTDELTALSDIAAVPAGVRDPVRAMGALFRAQGCPAAMRMYDGRRAVTIAPDGQSREGDDLICDLRYRVTDGPGHLSPLGISSAKLQLRFDTSGGQQRLETLTVASGVFRLTLLRQN